MEDVAPSKLHVVYCDTRIASTEEFTKEDVPIAMSAKGGGGTSFIPPFEWAEEQNIRPACFIYLTDMGSNQFPSEPDYPTLWINTSRAQSAPFGQVVQMEM